MKFTSREEKLIQLIKERELSPSHDFDHLKRVAEYAETLVQKYGGRREIVISAALIHDLARIEADKRGRRNAERGAELARPFLEKVGYSDDETSVICRIIAEHDQPELRSGLVESQILKDADFLDGFGARGILRSVMYAGETGGGVVEAKRRLQVTARKRLAGLEFEESKRLGWRLHRLTEVFLDELESYGQGQTLSVMDYPGKFIVIEGISGSGKGTQAEMLADYFKRQSKGAVVVPHPTEFLKQKIWRKWREEVDDRASEAFLMLADRVRMVRSKILPALKQRKIVISTRSSISAQVYQADEWFADELYRLFFVFEPVPDLVIYLDIKADEALKRTDKRVKERTEKDRGFFGQKQKRQLKQYKEILKHYPNVVKIDATGSKEEVGRRIAACVEETFSLR